MHGQVDHQLAVGAAFHRRDIEFAKDENRPGNNLLYYLFPTGEIAMAESLIEKFEIFYIGLPPNVRSDLAFMMVMLCNEDLVFHDPAEVYELASHGLFKSTTRLGCIGDLIYAVSVLDVYFAMNVRDRFGVDSLKRPRRSTTNVPPDFYAGEVDAIHDARRRWLELRATSFAPDVIATALIPPEPPQKRPQSSSRPLPRHKRDSS